MHGLRIDLTRNKVTRKHRWRIWKGSRIIGAATQGYHNRSECYDNLQEVTGGHLAALQDGLVLVRPQYYGDATVNETIPVREKGDG